MRYIALLAVVLLVGTALTIEYTSNWVISEDFEVKFTSKNPKGHFSHLEGDIVFDKNDLANSSFDMRINVEDIRTGYWLKNKHARGSKWFDIEKFPHVTFKSQTIEKTASGYTTTGILGMHGVEKEVSIPFTFEDNTFNGSLTVRRADFDLGPTGGMMGRAAAEVLVEITVPVSTVD